LALALQVVDLHCQKQYFDKYLRIVNLSMEELLRTNDMVLISFIESMLNDAGISHHVMDINMSVIEGSLGVLPRRIMVDSHQITRARRIVKEADIDAL